MFVKKHLGHEKWMVGVWKTTFFLGPGFFSERLLLVSGSVCLKILFGEASVAYIICLHNPESHHFVIPYHHVRGGDLTLNSPLHLKDLKCCNYKEFGSMYDIYLPTLCMANAQVHICNIHQTRRRKKKY